MSRPTRARPAPPALVRLESGDCPWTGPLESFLQANADALDWIEAETIRETLAHGAPYFGGGGAGPVWALYPDGRPVRSCPALT